MKVEKEDVIPGMYEVGSLAAHLQIERLPYGGTKRNDARTDDLRGAKV
jgi:hypothetical protein